MVSGLSGLKPLGLIENLQERVSVMISIAVIA